MKKLECIVRPEKLGDIKTALGALGINGMTASDACGVGRQKAHTEFRWRKRFEFELERLVRRLFDL